MPQERRLATLLFADIVGSSTVTGTHDPEVVRHTLAAAFAAMRRVLIEHGGTVEKFIGDAVMAVFGVPTAHDDDALRAVRAAFTLRAALLEGGGSDLRLRIGINTGEVVAGDEEHAETLVTGTPVIAASRLQSAAAPDEILVGALTRRLTEDRFEYGPARAVAAKNMGEIEASAVLGPAGRRSGARRSRFVGRGAEVARFRAARDAVARSGAAARMTVIGPPGIGKTRIAEQLGGGPLLWCHCSSYGQGDPLAPLQEIVRSLAGIASDDSTEVQRGKLEHVLLDRPASTTSATDGVARALALLSGDPWSREISLEQAQHDLAAAVAGFFDATRREEVTTLVIEDVHDAEPVLLRIVDEIEARVRHPLLVVALARPEILDRAAEWVARAETLELGPLGADDTEALTRSLLGERASGSVLDAILTRAGGIPLYVEQIVRTVLEGGDADAIPPTLRGLIAARLDQAGSDVRHLLQRGSALGRDFWLDAIPWEGATGIAGPAAEAEDRGLVAVFDVPGPTGEPTVRFTHALIRDVVYASTTKLDRMTLHAHYAGWYASIAEDRTDVSADTVAFHAEQAFRFAREIEHDRVHELGQRAFDALMIATRAARRRADYRTAFTQSARAMDVARDAELARPLAVQALGTHATIRLRLEPSAEAIQLLDRAIEAARAMPPGEHLVLLLTWRVGIALADDLDLAHRLTAEAVDVARATGDVEQLVYAISRSGVIGEATGALDEQARRLTEARDLALRTGARAWLPDTLAELSGNALHRGELEEARLHAEEAATAAATPLQRFKASVAGAWWLLVSGAVNDAGDEATAATILAREIGGPWTFALASELGAEVLLQRGDVAGARAIVADAVAKLDPDATPAMRTHVARLRAVSSRIHLRLEEIDTARSLALAACGVAPPTDVRSRSIGLWSLAEVDAASGRADDAHAHFIAALDAIEPTGYRMLAARIRSAYAAHVAEHAPAPKP